MTWEGSSRLGRQCPPHQAVQNTTTLLRLRFRERAEETANWYWIPAAYDRVDIAGGCFTGCKVESFADMRDIAAMPRAPAVHVKLGAPTAPAGLGLARGRTSSGSSPSRCRSPFPSQAPWRAVAAGWRFLFSYGRSMRREWPCCRRGGQTTT